MIVKSDYKSLSGINTAPIPTVLSIDTPTQMEPSFISNNVTFGSRTPPCTARKNQSQKCLLLFNRHLGLLELVPFYGLG
jgi:hypothetical protein